MDILPRKYIVVSFFNLLLVATIGVLLRYKILYSLPFIDQKNLLHGHSHFAFAGWITQTLMVLMVVYLSRKTGEDQFKSYKKILLANLFTAYGMLITFPAGGYNIYSIIFSTLSVFVIYFFAFRFWKDLNKTSEFYTTHCWFKTALLLAIFSSIGTFGLAFMMANKIIHQNWYLAAVYFYLHFQYNGWFFFACMGLFHSILPKEILSDRKMKTVFWLFSLASIPTYFLSTLWMPLPLFVYVIVVIASIAQFLAWSFFLFLLFQNSVNFAAQFSNTGKRVFILCAIALTIKLGLQLGSTIPALGQWAFGFRSIVIAYLHLVLLGIISLFLAGFIFSSGLLKIHKLTIAGLIIFIIGIFSNEFVLMLQGVASIKYNVIPFANEMLLLMALLIFLGVFLILISQYQRYK